MSLVIITEGMQLNQSVKLMNIPRLLPIPNNLWSAKFTLYYKIGQNCYSSKIIEAVSRENKLIGYGQHWIFLTSTFLSGNLMAVRRRPRKLIIPKLWFGLISNVIRTGPDINPVKVRFHSLLIVPVNQLIQLPFFKKKNKRI